MKPKQKLSQDLIGELALEFAKQSVSKKVTIVSYPDELVLEFFQKFDKFLESFSKVNDSRLGPEWDIE